MKKMSTRTFKAQCLSLVNKVHATGEPVLITKCGRPFVKLLPAKKADNIFGCLQGVIKIVGDIESPVVPPEDWEALPLILVDRDTPSKRTLTAEVAENRSTLPHHYPANGPTMFGTGGADPPKMTM